MVFDWIQLAFNVFGPVAVAGLIYVFSQIQNLKTDYALSKNNIATLQNVVSSEAATAADIPGRVIKIETTIPYVVASVEELKKMVNSLQASAQRIEVLIAKNTPTGSHD